MLTKKPASDVKKSDAEGIKKCTKAVLVYGGWPARAGKKSLGCLPQTESLDLCNPVQTGLVS